MNASQDNVRRQVLDKLEALDVLELVDFRPEQMQKAGAQIRACCPIHKDAEHRTLAVDQVEKTYKCGYAACPGHAGGDLINLFARAKGLDDHGAITQLCDEFSIEVVVPITESEIDLTIQEAEAEIASIDKDLAHGSRHAEQARSLLRRVLETQPGNVAALRAMYQLRVATRDAVGVAESALRLLEMAAASGEELDTIAVVAPALELDPENLVLRRRLAMAYLEAGREADAANEFLQLAELAESRSNLAAALDAYRQIQVIGSSPVDVHSLIVPLLLAQGEAGAAVKELAARAQWHMRRNELDEAREALTEALEIDPKNDDSRLRLVELQIQRGLTPETLSEALATADQMIEMAHDEAAAQALASLAGADPTNAPILGRLVRVNKRLGNTELATEFQYRLGELHLESGQAGEALAVLESILAEQPADFRALSAVARVHELAGSLDVAAETLGRLAGHQEAAEAFQDALATVDRVVRLVPTDAGSRERRARLLLRLDRKADALAAFLALADAYQEFDDYSSVDRVLREAIALDPGNPTHLIQLAAATAELGDLATAREQRLQACDLQLANKQFSDAEAQLQLLLDAEPGDVAVLERLAASYAGLGRKAEARAMAQSLSEAHRAKGRLDEARRVLEGLVSADPEDLDTLDRVADLCHEMKDPAGLGSAIERQIEVCKRRRDYQLAIAKAERLQKYLPADMRPYRHLIELHTLLGNKSQVLDMTHRLAEMFRELGDDEAEREALEEMLARDAQNVEARERLVFLLQDAGERGVLIDQMDTLIELCRKQGDLDRPAKLLRELIARAPNEPALHIRLMQLLEAQGNESEAVSQALILIPLHERRGERDEVIALYRKTIRLQPDNSIHRSNLIKELVRAGEKAEAVEQYEILARGYMEQNRYDDAEHAYREIRRLEPENEGAYRMLSDIHRKRNRPEKAVEVLRELAAKQLEVSRSQHAVDTLRAILTIDPSNVPVQRQIIDILVAEGDRHDAVAEVERLAEMHLQSGDRHAVLACCREAVSLMPEEATLRQALIEQLAGAGMHDDALGERFNLARLHLQKKEPAKALELLGAIIEKDPDNIRARRMRAETYAASGDDKKALAEFIQLAPMLDGSGTGGPAPSPPRKLQIMSEYDFDRFVVGPRNQFAHATCQAIAKSPGESYNPLFLYSDVGLGKTHLMHAIANQLVRENPKTNILYTNSEDFTTELIEAIETNTIIQFRNRHKAVDVLLLDDVQFLAGKERSQEEFFHIFNTLFQAKKQIVLTSDRPPKDIAHLEKRLKSRFGAGVVVDIQAPDLETRIAILHREAKRPGKTPIPEEVLEMVAKRIDSNIRELKGALNQIIVAHEIGKEPLDRKTTQRVIEKLTASRP